MRSEHSEAGEAGVTRGRGRWTTGPGVRVLCGLLGGALVAGCGPDAQGKFDEFVEQTKEDGSGGTTTGPGTTTEEPTTGEPTVGSSGGPVAFDINGDFLLAVSTTVNPATPLQFIATNTVTDDGATLKTCLQPLTLTQGKVLVPREPIGDPLCFEGLKIDNGAFTIDAGVVMVTGAANPITQANITATLIMMGTIQSDDLYCGTVTGNVTDPPVGDITGSKFAAVRLTDTAVLPNPVVIDCKGTSVTDK